MVRIDTSSIPTKMIKLGPILPERIGEWTYIKLVAKSMSEDYVPVM